MKSYFLFFCGNYKRTEGNSVRGEIEERRRMCGFGEFPRSFRSLRKGKTKNERTGI